MKSRETYHHGDLRQALIEEAIALIAEQGVSNWSLREVARRIGVSHTAPYRHFADRDALLAAVAEKGFQQMVAHLLQALKQSSGEHSEQLQAIGIAYVQYAIAHPSEYEVMFRHSRKMDEKHYPALTEAATKAFMVLVNVIVEGQKESAFRSGNPKELAWVAWSLVHGLSMLLVDGQIQDLEGSTVETLAGFTTQMLTEGLQNRDRFV